MRIYCRRVRRRGRREVERETKDYRRGADGAEISNYKRIFTKGTGDKRMGQRKKERSVPAAGRIRPA